MPSALSGTHRPGEASAARCVPHEESVWEVFVESMFREKNVNETKLPQMQ